MSAVSVREYVDAAIDSETLQRAQVQSAGAVVSQFLLVRRGLQGRIPDAELSATAATLTAGIWASKENG